jgi:hypothetical protein
MPKKINCIGLVGVPNAGKSALARAIVDAQEDPENWIVIDGYVEHLVDQLDIYIGAEAQYIPNLFLAYEREFQHRIAERTGKNLIVCGTILETISYIAVKVEELSNQVKGDLVKREVLKQLAAAEILAAMLEDTWRYTQIYYLEANPVPRMVTINGEETEDPWAAYYGHVDEAIKEGLSKINRNYFGFNSTVSLEDRLAQALKDITPQETGA